MTTYENTTKTPHCIELPNDRRGKLTRICFDCFNSARHREDFTQTIDLIKPILLGSSDTPMLDEAYIDGITTALATIKQEKP